MTVDKIEEFTELYLDALSRIEACDWPASLGSFSKNEKFAKKLIELEIELDQGKDSCGYESLERLSAELKDNKSFFINLFRDLPDGLSSGSLEFLSSRLRDDEEIVEAFLKCYFSPLATEFMSVRLKSDKEFIFNMLSAGHQLYLNYLSPKLINDREFILSISGFIRSWEIPKKFREDRDILLRTNKLAMVSVYSLSMELRKDYTFIHKMFKYYNENNRDRFQTFETRDKYVNPAMYDFEKLRGYETIIKTVMKLNLPLEIGRIVYDYV